MTEIFFLKKLPLFDQLTEQQLSTITKMFVQKSYPKSARIFRAKDSAEYLYIVLHGKIKMSTTLANGREHTLNILTAQDLIGEVAIFTQGGYPADCTTLVDSILLAIPKVKFISLLKQYPQIAINIIILQAKKLREFTSKIEQLSLQDITQRVATYLIKNSKHGHIELSTNIQELANYIGSSREAISRTLSNLESQQLIKKEGKKITLLDQEKLNIIAT